MYWGAALVAVLVIAFSSLSSTGITRYQGGDDEGSGIGGTGIRQLRQDFGESGFGGTGLKPYLGYIDGEVTPLTTFSNPLNTSAQLHLAESRPFSLEHSVGFAPLDVTVPIADQIVEHGLQVATPATAFAQRESDNTLNEFQATVEISTAIQENIDANALIYQELADALPRSQSNPRDIEATVSAVVADNATLLDSEVDEPRSPEPSSTLITNGANAANAANAQENTPGPWQKFSSYLASSSKADGIAAATSKQVLAEAQQATQIDDAAQSTPQLIEVSGKQRALNKDARNRLQRPALPPVQRIRPIERMSVLPPRIQPMRL